MALGDDIRDGVQNHIAGMEIEDPADVVGVAVDMTLQAVVGWLRQRPSWMLSEELADDLEAMLDV